MALVAIVTFFTLNAHHHCHCHSRLRLVFVLVVCCRCLHFPDCHPWHPWHNHLSLLPSMLSLLLSLIFCLRHPHRCAIHAPCFRCCHCPPHFFMSSSLSTTLPLWLTIFSIKLYFLVECAICEVISHRPNFAPPLPQPACVYLYRAAMWKEWWDMIGSLKFSRSFSHHFFN